MPSPYKSVMSKQYSWPAQICVDVVCLYSTLGSVYGYSPLSSEASWQSGPGCSCLSVQAISFGYLSGISPDMLELIVGRRFSTSR